LKVFWARGGLLSYGRCDLSVICDLPMAAAILSALCLGACDVDATAHYDKVLAELSNQNYTYSKAVMRVKDIQSFGANSGNPYFMYDEMPEQRTYLGVPYWPMHSADAVLFIGCTPPDAEYFSWRSYLFRGGGDHLVFASMGDSSNNLAVKTQGSSAADARIAVVTTGDATTYTDVSAALDVAGLGSATNLEQVELTLFDGESAEYTMLHRASVWNDSTVREEYFKRNSTIYYIRAPPARAPHALPLSKPRPRGTGHPESDVPGLVDAQTSLTEEVVARFASLHGQLHDTSVCAFTNISGRVCIATDTDCLGDNPDANYFNCYSSSDPHALGPQDAYVLISSNCVATGKCTYHNAGVYSGARKSTSVTTDNRAWNGSALAFAPTLDPMLASMLAAVVFARDCTTFTSSVVGSLCVPIPFDQIVRGQTWFPVVRTYLEPATATGPLVSEVFTPVLLHFIL